MAIDERGRRRYIGIAAIVALSFLGGCGRPSTSENSAATAPAISSVRAPANERAATPADPARPHEDRKAESDSNDLALSARISVQPGKAAPGNPVKLIVRVNVRPGWHIGALAVQSGPTVPSQFSMNLPAGVRSIGDWQSPSTATLFDNRGPSAGYAGDLTFTHELAVDAKLPAGPVEIGCRFKYQACNESLCLPPDELNLTTTLELTK